MHYFFAICFIIGIIVIISDYVKSKNIEILKDIQTIEYKDGCVILNREIIIDDVKEIVDITFTPLGMSISKKKK